MKKILIILCVFAFQSTISIDESQLLKDLKTLSSDDYKGRATDTEGTRLSREYIIERMQSMGITPWGNHYVDTFQFKHEHTGEPTTGHNIGAMIPGELTDKFLVLSAHYDHLGIHDGLIHNGADDNASGTCALLAMMDHFRKEKPKHSLIFLFTDAEELGLIGGYHFVESWNKSNGQITSNINMDMIGRNTKNEIYLCGKNHYPDHFKSLEDIDSASPLHVKFGHDHKKLGKDDWTMASDHAPFHEAKIPFVYVGVEDHPDYHKHTDDFDKIKPAFYIDAVKLMINITQRIDKNDDYEH